MSPRDRQTIAWALIGLALLVAEAAATASSTPTENRHHGVDTICIPGEADVAEAFEALSGRGPTFVEDVCSLVAEGRFPALEQEAGDRCSQVGRQRDEG